jgi:lipoprotein-anchoring transpeptidase ErfK/SrfK
MLRFLHTVRIATLAFVITASVVAPACAGIDLFRLPPGLDDGNTLRPGEYVWKPEISPRGPVRVRVSLSEQRVYVYRNDILIGVSTATTGGLTNETPTGTFPILQKRVDHWSNLYPDSPMPFMQRLTHDGVALHSGYITNRPLSHGCIRLPHGFAEHLYNTTKIGTRVVIEE